MNTEYVLNAETRDCITLKKIQNNLTLMVCAVHCSKSYTVLTHLVLATTL